jgi:hypothetical protein
MTTANGGGNYPMTVETADILGAASSVAASHGEAI